MIPGTDLFNNEVFIMELQEFINTEEAAKMFGVKGHSLRAQYCTTGSYFGLIPRKMPNGRLLWARRDIEEMLERAA